MSSIAALFGGTVSSSPFDSLDTPAAAAAAYVGPLATGAAPIC